MQPTYKIIRHYQLGDNETIRTGLTLEQAQTHCQDPETSSSTCTTQDGFHRTDTYGPWFDGYSSE